MLKKKSVRIVFLVIILAIIGGGGLLGYYRLSRIQRTKQEEIINKELENTTAATKVIVYTQDRAFKNDIMNEVKKEVESQKIYMEIQPIEEMDSDFSKWDKVVIFGTVQSSEPPGNSRAVIEEHLGDKKMGIFLTADSGVWSHQPEDVDVFASASKNENSKVFKEKILAFIDNK